MKRFSTIGILLLTLCAFLAISSVSYAGDGCLAKNTKNVGGDETYSKSCCPGHAPGKTCTPEEKATCAARLGLTPEECEKFCKSGDYGFVNMSVKGMTCGGCEASITKALQGVAGVVRVGKVSHQEGSAFVVIDPKKAKVDDLVTTVTGKGYKAEIIPAVATVTKAGDSKHSKLGCSVPCTKKCAKTCAGHVKSKAKVEGAKAQTDGSK